MDGTSGRPGPPWSGNASRLNHACRKQTAYGRWKRFGRLWVLEFRANGELGEGTELTWSYERIGPKSYTVSESTARTLMFEGILVDPCGCGRSEPCPAHRFVPRADLDPARLVTGLDERLSGGVFGYAGAGGVIRPRSESCGQRGRGGSAGSQGGSGRELVCRSHRSLKWSKSLSPTTSNLRALGDEDDGGLGRMGARARRELLTDNSMMTETERRGGVLPSVVRARGRGRFNAAELSSIFRGAVISSQLERTSRQGYFASWRTVVT